MKLLKSLIAFAALAASFCACDDSKSYAELLTDENQAVNYFLVNQRVVGEVPSDTVFEVGINAPYYQLDDDGNVYMQVLNTGNPDLKPETSQLVYFRFTRYSVLTYSCSSTSTNKYGYYGEFDTGEGNSSDLSYGSYSFRFKDFTTPTSQQWGEGIQLPLLYLPLDCEVNLILKSPMGFSSDESYVVPYFLNVRYFKSQI